MMMFSIGEFSKLTGLTVKTLRFYHEQNLLVPSRVDGQSGYRYYSNEKIELARIISTLRELEFTLSDISEILNQYDDEADILDYVEQQIGFISQRMKQDRKTIQSLKQILSKERETIKMMQTTKFEVEEKEVEPLLIAGIRMKGRYRDCGKGFGQLGRKVGRYMHGKPLMLYYDCEYREEDADYEVCFPVNEKCLSKQIEGVSVRELPAGKCLSLLHHGPYEELKRSYEVLMRIVNDRGLELEEASREIYIKGPGMIFRGNPKKYLTEIQLFYSASFSNRVRTSL